MNSHHRHYIHIRVWILFTKHVTCTICWIFSVIGSQYLLVSFIVKANDLVIHSKNWFGHLYSLIDSWESQETLCQFQNWISSRVGSDSLSPSVIVSRIWRISSPVLPLRSIETRRSLDIITNEKSLRNGAQDSHAPEVYESGSDDTQGIIFDALVHKTTNTLTFRDYTGQRSHKVGDIIDTVIIRTTTTKGNRHNVIIKSNVLDGRRSESRKHDKITPCSVNAGGVPSDSHIMPSIPELRNPLWTLIKLARAWREVHEPVLSYKKSEEVRGSTVDDKDRNVPCHKILKYKNKKELLRVLIRITNQYQSLQHRLLPSH